MSVYISGLLGLLGFAATNGLCSTLLWRRCGASLRSGRRCPERVRGLRQACTYHRGVRLTSYDFERLSPESMALRAQRAERHLLRAQRRAEREALREQREIQPQSGKAVRVLKAQRVLREQRRPRRSCSWGAQRMLACAVWGLPHGQRDRWGEELSAELFELVASGWSRPRQILHGLRVLMRMPALRRSLREPAWAREVPR